MADYDFHQLSPSDLEILTRDLLQAHWGVTLENFKTGKDRGIDLRYATAKGKVVIQVKHYVRTGLNGLLRDLKTEAAKLTLLQPSRYVLVTSVPLSPPNKDAIVTIFGDHILAPEDVIGCESLNNLLGQYPEIEGKHFKLWLASRPVLDRVLHNAAVTRSEFKVRQVYQEARRYVQSEAYLDALTMLGEHGLVIIAGPPGVGKTTLANLLLYEHIEKGYQAVLIQRDIEEGQSLIQEGVRQVFYFDDFMGATFLGDRAFTGNNDRALLEFIAMVRATPTARLILTTREHIYSQAMERSERMRHSDIDDFRVFLRMPSYSFSQKARILYNHLYFSDLPAEYQDELLRDQFYLRIIKHEKFNPRIIEWLSSFRRLQKIPVDQYRSFVENLLRDPSEIWRHAYEQEISDAGRSILLTLFSLGGKIAVDILKRGFQALHSERARKYGFKNRPEDFRSALREVAGSFIKPVGAHGVEVVDPSVLDLLNAVVKAAPENAVDIVAGAATFNQIERVWLFAKAEKNGTVFEALVAGADSIVHSVGLRMLDRRRYKQGDDVVVHYGPTFERRLAIVIDMADRTSSDKFLSLVEPLFARLIEEWQTTSPDVDDAVSVLRSLDKAHSLPEDVVVRIRESIQTALLDVIQRSCRSNELCQVITAMGISGGNMLAAALAAFKRYQHTEFDDELGDCRSVEEFDGLIEDLETMKSELHVDVAPLIERVTEAKIEFELRADEYADHMQDEWKEQWYNEREGERSVSDMFASLKDDRP